MKILVTGGAGFIGSHFTCALLNRGHKVTVADTFTNFAGGDFYDNFDYRKKLIDGALLYAKRASHPSVWQNQFEVVVHLAGIPIIKPKIGDFFEENVRETEKVLTLARKNKTRKFIFMSSIYAYGGYRGVPYKEDFSLEPQDSYGYTKAIGEYLTRYYFQDLEWVIIRTAGVYGFGDHNLRISRLIIELYKKLPRLTITRNVLRNFIYVDDLVDGLVAAVEPPIANHAFNLVTETILLEDFAKEAKKFLPHLSWSLGDIPEGELIIGPVSTQKARKLLGFSPKFPVRTGIEDYIEKIKRFSN